MKDLSDDYIVQRIKYDYTLEMDEKINKGTEEVDYLVDIPITRVNIKSKNDEGKFNNKLNTYRRFYCCLLEVGN